MELKERDGPITQIQGQEETFFEGLERGLCLLMEDRRLGTPWGNLLEGGRSLGKALKGGDLQLSATETFSDKLTGLDAAFGFLNAELFQVLPAEFTAGFDTVADGGTIDFTVLDPGLADRRGAPHFGGAPTQPFWREATPDLTEANTVLTGIDLTGQPSDIASLIPTSTELIGSQEMLQAGLINIQNVIADAQMQGSSMPGYDLMQATTALFTSSDQDLLNADAALLASDQLLAGAISGGTGLTDADTLESAVTTLGAMGADFSALGTTFDAAFTPFLELFTAF